MRLLLAMLFVSACAHRPASNAPASHPCEGEAVHSNACRQWAVTYATCRSRATFGTPIAAVTEGMTEAERKAEAKLLAACK